MGNACKKNVDEDPKKKKKEEELQHIFGFTKDGVKKDQDQAGQDAYDIIQSELGTNLRFFAVYDGHGIKGREAAHLAREEIRRSLLKDRGILAKFTERKDAERYFQKLFAAVQSKFKKKATEFEVSGTCVIAILIVGNHCFIINLGDSRGVIGHLLSSNQKVAYQMSIDHKANRPEEKERIEKSGGYVAIEHEGGFGPFRVYSKNDEGPGLAVARSLGDIFGHTVGISAVPEVSYKMLEEQDIFIIIGSDGIWDCLNSSEVVGFIFDKLEKEISWTKQRIVEELVQESRNRWELINIYKEKILLEKISLKDETKAVGIKPTIKQNIDDITAVICFFNLST